MKKLKFVKEKLIIWKSNVSGIQDTRIEKGLFFDASTDRGCPGMSLMG